MEKTLTFYYDSCNSLFTKEGNAGRATLQINYGFPAGVYLRITRSPRILAKERSILLASMYFPINPLFLNFKAQRILPYFRFLKKHNQCIVMGAFGMDYYYVTGCLDKQTFRYSDFNIGPVERINRDNDQFKQEWLYGFNGELNQIIAKESHAIVTGLYEYDACYRKYYHGSAKLVFIPFPIQMQSIETHYDDSPRLATAAPRHNESQFIPGEPLKIFVGIQSQRSTYKGTDILLRAAQRVAQEHPQECVLLKAENVPFETYKHIIYA